MASVTKLEKTSDAIKKHLQQAELPIKELEEIFNCLTTMIVESLGRSESHDLEAKAGYEGIKQRARYVAKSLNQLSGLTGPKCFSITVEKNKYLQLRKTYKNSDHHSWHFDYKNEQGRRSSEFLGRDTETRREEIEKRFNINLSQLAPYLPPPMPPKAAAVRRRRPTAQGPGDSTPVPN